MHPRKLAWLLVPLVFASCATLQEGKAQYDEKKLVKAGFHVETADTPQKEALLTGMTPYKLEYQPHHGTTIYRYADPVQKKVYFGGPAEFSTYQNLVAHSNYERAVSMSNMMNFYGSAWAGPYVW